MSIYPVEDWPYFFRYRKKANRRYYNKSKHLKEILPEVRKALQENGPLSSIDLKFDRKVNWSWAPTRAARAALESMYSWGELIIHHKVGTRKVYNFAKKHLPLKLLSKDDPNLTSEEYYQWYIKRRIGSVGMLWGLSGSNAWLGINGLKKKELDTALSSLLQNKEIIKLRVENIKHPVYIRKDEESSLQQIQSKNDLIPQVAIIAPLDNLLWDRDLINKIFDFEYVWEVYKPVSERKYGYYVLPILYGDRFIARFEPVFEKKTGEFIIKNWWWEPDVLLTNQLKEALEDCLKQFSRYLNASTIKLNCKLGF